MALNHVIIRMSGEKALDFGFTLPLNNSNVYKMSFCTILGCVSEKTVFTLKFGSKTDLGLFLANQKIFSF